MQLDYVTSHSIEGPSSTWRESSSSPFKLVRVDKCKSSEIVALNRNNTSTLFTSLSSLKPPTTVSTSGITPYALIYNKELDVIYDTPNYSGLVSEDKVKRAKFKLVLMDENVVGMDELKKLCWSGVPMSYRPLAWKILCHYAPSNKIRRDTALLSKRNEYKQLVSVYYAARLERNNQGLWHQITIDVPRTSPGPAYFKQDNIQTIMARILFLVTIRRPASSYVQGMNDLLTPFFHTFIENQISSNTQLELTEADTFWCLSHLLDGLHDNYTFAQKGIQNSIAKLKNLVKQIDQQLNDHFEALEIDYMLFAFRWINCFLMRDLPFHCIVRMWDTYLSEPEGFTAFHIYVCAAFLLSWAQPLKNMPDFNTILTFLQNLPTSAWTHSHIELILAQAFMFKEIYHHSRL